MSVNSIYIYGVHPVTQALTHQPDTVMEVLFATDFSDQSLRQQVRDAGIATGSFQSEHPPHSVDGSDTHQGVVAQINTDKLTQSLDYGLQAWGGDSRQAVMVLGELQDPQNVGAVIRSAAAFGFDGVLLPQRRQAQITSSVVSVSAGMVFRVPIISIGNVNMTLEKLKEHDFWVYGLVGAAPESITDQSFDRSTAVVVGNEASGIREKTREHCDKLISIPTKDNIPLNAATAAGIAGYAVQS